MGIMTELDIHNAYKSWRNSVVIDCNASRKTIRATDAMYEKLFPAHEKYIRQKRKVVLNEIRKENSDEIRRRKR